MVPKGAPILGTEVEPMTGMLAWAHWRGVLPRRAAWGWAEGEGLLGGHQLKKGLLLVVGPAGES